MYKTSNLPAFGGLITAELEGIVAKALPIVKLSGSSPWIPVICPDLLSKDCENILLKTCLLLICPDLLSKECNNIVLKTCLLFSSWDKGLFKMSMTRIPSRVFKKAWLSPVQSCHVNYGNHYSCKM